MQRICGSLTRNVEKLMPITGNKPTPTIPLKFVLLATSWGPNFGYVLMPFDVRAPIYQRSSSHSTLQWPATSPALCFASGTAEIQGHQAWCASQTGSRTAESTTRCSKPLLRVCEKHT